MIYIRVNDVFDEIVDENKRLLKELLIANKLLKNYSQFKCFIDQSSHQFKQNLDENQRKIYQELSDNIDKSVDLNDICVDTKDEIISDQRVGSQLTECQSTNKASNESTINPSIQTNGSQCKARKSFVKSTNNVKKQKPKTPAMVKPLKRFYCEFIGCGKYFSIEKTLRRHRSIHTRVVVIKREGDTEKLFCPVDGCPYQTTDKELLKKHSRTHLTDIPFVCDHCHKRFKTKERLGYHVRRVHRLADTLLVCAMDGCQRQYKTECALKYHQRVNHLREQKYVCNYPGCNYKTSSRVSFDLHLPKHSDERPFVCTIDDCGRQYKNKSSLDSHIACIHFLGPKIQCSVDGCEKYFKNKQFMNRHISLDHSTECLSCVWPGCDYQTTNRLHLKSHQLVHTSELNFVCDWPQCGKRFKRSEYLKNHMKIHTNDKRHVCHWPGCLYRSTNSPNLNKHMRRVHNKP